MLNQDFRLFGFATGLALAVAISNPASATPYNDAVLDCNPSYYWTFDEAGVVNGIEQVQGLAEDEFVPGGNSVKVDSAITGGGVSLGQAARIEESGGFTWNVADLSGSGMTGAWAYEFWANADDVTTYEYMIGSGGAGFNNETILKWGPGGVPGSLQLYNGGGVINPVPMTVGWHHYVFVSDGATADYDLYVDGAFAGNIGNGTGHGSHPEGAIKLGGWTDGASAEVFDGLLDELAIYDLSGVGDLSAAGQKIANHYSEGGKLFQIVDVTRSVDAKKLTVTWTSRPNETYAVYQSVDLRDWIELDDGVESGGEQTTFDIDLADPPEERVFVYVAEREG